MKTTTTAPETIDPLAALASEAATLENEAKTQQTQQAQAQETQQAQSLELELLSALLLVRGMAGPLCHWMTLERFQKTWSNERLQAIAEPGAAIMQLNGWTVGALLGKWAPYLALIAAMGAPTLETIRAFKDAKAVTAAQPVEAPDDGNETTH